MENLPDDCWVHIFRRLPLKKRIQSEGVSPKWKRLMPYTDISSVNLATNFLWPKDRLIETEFGTKMFPKEDLRQLLMGILSRCGPKLRHLVLKVTCSRFVFGLNKDLADLLVEKAPSLVTLKMDTCLLSLHSLPILARLEKLEELHLVGMVWFMEDDLSTRIQDQAAIETALSSTIRSLPALKKLHLISYPQVHPTIHNAGLKDLKMKGGQKRSNLTAASLQDLVHHCPNLESLDMHINNLQMGALGGLHQLKNLTLYGGILCFDELAAICRGCPGLEKLDLHTYQELSGCADLWRLSHLKHLDIATREGNVPVDDAVLASVTKYGLLEYIALPWANLTDDGLHFLAAHCPHLVHLNISHIRAITDKGLKTVLERCQRLEELLLCGTSIGDETMAAIGANEISLVVVEADETRVTADGISRLVAERRKRLAEGQELVQLSVRVDCGSITQRDLDAVILDVYGIDIPE